MAVNIAGVISVVIFYILILLVGIWAGRKRKTASDDTETEEVMLAGRNIGLFVGIFTMTGKLEVVKSKIDTLLHFTDHYMCSFSYSNMGGWWIYQWNC